MKVYCGKNRRGVWKASLDKNKLRKFTDVFECYADVINNGKLYMVETYHGFYYNYGSTLTGLKEELTYEFKLYSSVSAARKSNTWKEKERIAKENPDKYHVTHFYIASDSCGEPFEHGNVMENKFNTKIIGVRVI